MPDKARRTDAERLRAGVEATGTRAQFAQLIGVSVSGLDGWLAGKPVMGPIPRLAWLLTTHPELAEEIRAEFD